MITIFTDSSFALFSATHILENTMQKAIVCTPNAGLYQQIQNLNCFDKVIEISPWPRGIARYYPKDKQRKQAQEQIITLLQQYSPKEIWLHEIYSDQWNWIAYTYKKLFPKGIIRLLPDGFLNASNHYLTAQKKSAQKLKSFLTNSYIPFEGEWIGLNAKYGNDDLVENIYLPLNFPHEYKEYQVEYFPLAMGAPKQSATKALLVEQSLLDRKYLNSTQLKHIYAELQQDWQNKGITDIYIAPHPKAKNRDFGFSDLPIYDRKNIFLEDDIAEGEFGHIYSCFSTIFFMAPSLSYNFISFGLEELQRFDKKDFYHQLLKKLGVSFL